MAVYLSGDLRFRLKNLMMERNVSQSQLAKVAGISESTYQKLVKKDSVRLDVLHRICSALHVDIGDVCSFRGFR